MLTHVYSERMLGSDYLDWLIKALFPSATLYQTNLCKCSIVPALQPLNWRKMKQMGITTEELPRRSIEQLPPVDLWYDEGLFSNIWCQTNPGKSILIIRSFTNIFLHRHPSWSVSSLKRLVLACRTSISRYRLLSPTSILSWFSSYRCSLSQTLHRYRRYCLDSVLQM